MGEFVGGGGEEGTNEGKGGKSAYPNLCSGI